MNKNVPLVSVIVPNYNHARYLPERMRSILSQTYPHYEIILLDDHSTDNSVEVLNGFRHDPHVSTILVNEKNSGSPFVQWGLGIKQAKGEIIWIAESDDTCESNFLETLVQAYLSVPNCAIAYCSTTWINENGEPQPTPVWHPYDELHTGKDFIKNRLPYGTDIWNASSAIFSRDIAEQIPEDYQGFRNSGDHLFWLELARFPGSNVVSIYKPLNYCRQHGNNVSSRKDRFLTIFSEEHSIYEKQVRYGYIKGLKKAFVTDRYRSKILSKPFQNEEDRQNALEIWGVRKPLQWICVKIGAILFRLLFKVPYSNKK